MLLYTTVSVYRLVVLVSTPNGYVGEGHGLTHLPLYMKLLL
jgi:hypothetical protein